MFRTLSGIQDFLSYPCSSARTLSSLFLHPKELSNHHETMELSFPKAMNHLTPNWSRRCSSIIQFGARCNWGLPSGPGYLVANSNLPHLNVSTGQNKCTFPIKPCACVQQQYLCTVRHLCAAKRAVGRSAAGQCQPSLSGYLSRPSPCSSSARLLLWSVLNGGKGK